MKYFSQAYLKNMSLEERDHIAATHYPLGYHPITDDILSLPVQDRAMGMYVLGVQGMGKSSFQVNQIAYGMRTGDALIVIDPHGDLIIDSIAHVPPERFAYVSLLDMEDIEYPFGLNILNIGTDMSNPIAVAQAIDRLMHVFEVIWPDVLAQAHLPRFLRAACIALMSNLGTTLLDMHPFLVDSVYRNKLLRAVKDQSVVQFWARFDTLSATQQRQQVESLLGRLESMFMGRSIVRNIIGQAETTIDFRRAIEQKEIIFIRLPLKTLPQDAKLIGTLLIAQIHAAIFSYADLPENERPSFSLYLDEFQEFATSKDIEELFTQGRKFGVRLTCAHQFRAQVPQLLQHATMTAGTKVCFRTTPDDAREMAHLFVREEVTIRPEDIDPRPVEHLLKYGSEDAPVQTFIDTYLRPLHAQIHSGQVEIKRLPWHEELVRKTFNPESAPVKPKTDDPTPYLNHLLYEVMKTGNSHQFIDPKIIYGYSNIGYGFYSAFLYTLNKKDVLAWDFQYPHPMILSGANGPYCARRPETSKEQLYHFLFHLQTTMVYLSANPIGKKTTRSVSDIAHDLSSLPKRAAWVSSGEDVGVIYTLDTDPWMSGDYLEECINFIREHTRGQYCRQIEQQIDSTDTNEPQQPTPRWEEIDE